jgi:ergothioneine biosynthesis protein EgtB
MTVAAAYHRVRDRTVELCGPLSAEDQVVQPMADASPTKWHLAHTSWFFEAFVLRDSPPFDPEFAALFNSYYEAVGPRIERARRGMLTRPSLERIHAYRAAVDQRVARALAEDRLDAGALATLELGLHHEQQHQELILTDLKYTLGTQPLAPAYRDDLVRDPPGEAAPLRWRSFDGGIVAIGAPEAGFAFDNERPRHDEIVTPFALASRPVTNADVLAFIAAGGYRDHRLWLSDGWQTVRSEGWHAPLYWADGERTYELAGVRAIDPAETACHLSYYEADAIARWLGARLPTEAEWEVAAAHVSPAHANLADGGRLHPTRAPDDALAQMFGDVWEWTSSSYSAYPGFRPLAGALGEYNGKFMSGQMVLRGGSCFTPSGHIRASYRNFFPPAARWQMTGVRLAKDV